MKPPTKFQAFLIQNLRAHAVQDFGQNKTDEMTDQTLLAIYESAGVVQNISMMYLMMRLAELAPGIGRN